MPLVLASGSARRAELLAAAGFSFEIDVPNVDETLRPGESSDSYVRRLALEKARVVATKRPGRLVLAADTTVILDGAILGKPDDAADATRMLTRLAGHIHEVRTGVCVMYGAHTETQTALTLVEFAPMTAAEIAWYVASGEPMDKAGAYGIQGLASRFVRRVDGSYSNVVGLPVSLVWEMMNRAPSD